MDDPATSADYFRRRAEQELELAQRATSPEAVSAHYRLAEAYLQKAETAQASIEKMPE